MNITDQKHRAIGYIDVSRTDYVKHFKDGVADGLLNGNMADEYRYGYKQGYDFGIEMYSEINKLDEEENETRT